MKDELKTALREAFNAPEPERKQAFLRDLRVREIGTPQMLLQQIGYIRISVWIFTGAMIAFVLFGSWIRLDETAELLAEIIPYLAAVSVLESMRSEKYGMTELEMVTRFSLKSVIFARMLILGVAFLLFLAIASPVIAVTFGMETILATVNILIPYLVTMSISLQVERSFRGRITEYSSIVVAAIVSGSCILINSYQPALVQSYMEIVKTWGVLMAIILAAITVFEQWRTINSMEALA